jgi:hypothetical protein|nr:MAG TPA: hypothetical protein [Caudoviricetes sp.]
MALTATEENQLRELLRRTNTTSSGKLAHDLSSWTGAQPSQVWISAVGNRLVRTTGHEVAAMATLADVTSGNASSASNTVNHLMTRDATRAEITRMTQSAINDAANLGRVAQASANTNTASINNLRSDHSGRLTAIENWRRSFVDPGLERRIGVVGGVYESNPIMQAGPMNPPGGDITNRTHRFRVALTRDPMIFFSLQGDVNYPRYEFLVEGGKVVGFTMFHSPPPGRWMAIGQQA